MRGGFLIYGGWIWRMIPSVYNGMAVYPLILFRHLNPSERMIRHERIHLRQQIELAIIFFYVWYMIEYWIHRLRGKKHYAAYMHISFEREAYAHDNNETYLTNRRMWAFIKYLG